MKNFNELRQIKRQNEIIKKRMEEASNMLMVKKEDNINLKNKLHEFQKRFRIIRKNPQKKRNHFLRIYYKHKKRKEIVEFFIPRKTWGIIATLFLIVLIM